MPRASASQTSFFGPYAKSKALCACGALTDVDEEVLRRKIGLGKKVECAKCRNKRIAAERAASDEGYLYSDEED